MILVKKMPAPFDSLAMPRNLPPVRVTSPDEEAAAELGYVRDPLASGLRRVGTSTIGVVVPHLTDTVMAMFYEEIAAASKGATRTQK